MQIYLKVKIKSLAAEARIIRAEELKIIGRRERPYGKPIQDLNTGVMHFEEDKAKPKIRVGGQLPWLRNHQAAATEIDAALNLYHGLRMHRINEVRGEARSSLLAYALIRDRPYVSAEGLGSSWPDVGRIASLATKYGGKKITENQAKAWIEASYKAAGMKAA